jgi:hypothetical protein
MYPKYKCQKLIAEHSDRLRKELRIPKTYKITWYVMSTKTKITKKFGMTQMDNTHAVTYIGANHTFDIVLFYDMAKSRKDALATIIHELLHVKIHPLAQMVTLMQDKALTKEEEIVTTLERFIIKYYK